jgi:hypothetical protein
MFRQALGLGADIQDQAVFAMAGRVLASYELDLRQIIKTGKEPREWAAAALGFHPVSVCRMVALHSYQGRSEASCKKDIVVPNPRHVCANSERSKREPRNALDGRSIHHDHTFSSGNIWPQRNSGQNYFNGTNFKVRFG